MTARKRSSNREWTDSDDAPEWASEVFDRAQISVDGKIIRGAAGTLTKRGRPPVGDEPKQQVTLRLAPRVIRYFKEDGEGWQTRLNETLEEYVTAAVVADVRRKNVRMSDLVKNMSLREERSSATNKTIRSALTGKIASRSHKQRPDKKRA
jgi:uncharacterized protein (DUF4415 family)